MSETAVVDSKRVFPMFLLPPPLFFGLAFGAGMLIQTFAPLGFPEPPFLQPVALLVLAAGLVCAPCLAITFLIRRTTLNPFAAPSTFLARGLYRFSRNPMYLGVVLVYLAGTLLVGSLWPLVLLVVPLLILDRVVIPFEEANMRTAFGDSYQSYCARVRRWV